MVEVRPPLGGGLAGGLKVDWLVVSRGIGWWCLAALE